MKNVFEGLPPSLRIGPFDISVKIKAKIDDEDHAGLYTNGVSIELRADQHNAVYAVDTVLHEIGHALYQNAGLGQKSSEESVCAAMATGWTQVWRDNPALMVWLFRTLPDK